MVSAWGATTAVVALFVSRGSTLALIAALIAVGVGQRAVAVNIARRRGDHPPPWWRV